LGQIVRLFIIIGEFECDLAGSRYKFSQSGIESGGMAFFHDLFAPFMSLGAHWLDFAGVFSYLDEAQREKL
jgi:hypothetical protein